ncbi:MAG TPA: NAD(P)H-quinone oxidoreductase [Longimicrobiales bacterium]|nr:NAD(P)H-quinone oxidoreductase [Longimicrobiales bacterium]
MRAIVISRPGGPDVLELRDVAMPSPGPGEIRVRVAATAVNLADLLQRAGRYPPPAGVPRDIPGLEYAGVVDALGEGATRWTAGAEVMGLVGGGSYAEYVVTHEDEAVAVPAGLSLEAAASVPEAFITAHDALFTQMRLRAGETVLIHAVGSGVGTAGLQLARAAGARVIGTQRSAWKLDRALELGLDVAVDTGTEDFVEAAMRETSGRGVDGVLDLVGGDYLGGDLRALAVRGRILLVGLVAGARHELDLRLLLGRRATIIGTVLRARSLDEKIAAARAFEHDVLPLLESGAVVPVIDQVLPLDDAARAHERVADNRNYGKVVLRLA